MRSAGARRYAAGDAVEAWLNGLLCLDAAEHVPRPPARLPHPSECELYHVERDTLFSFHKVRWSGLGLGLVPLIPDPAHEPDLSIHKARRCLCA